MTPTVSPNKKNAPYGFLLGVMGGMAAYYLTQSKSGQKLRRSLIDIYDSAKIESGQWLEEYLTESPKHIDKTEFLESIQISPKTSWFAKLKQALSRPKPPAPTLSTAKPKRYFQKKSKKKR